MKLLTPTFKTGIALRSYEQLATSNTYYVVGAYSQSSDTEIADTVNTIDNTVYDFDRNIVFGKKLTANDVMIVTRNIPWVAGNKYEMYDDKAIDLDTKDFYVVTDDINSSKSVFKCLYNGRIHSGNTYTVTPVSDMPTIAKVSPDDEYYRTADGYVWKFMTNSTEEDVTKFSTNGFIPVKVNTAVTANAVNGAIDTILIEDTGGKYMSFAQGNVKTADFGGNTRKLALESNLQQIMYTFDVVMAGNTAFTIGDSTTVTVTMPSGTIAFTGTLYSANTSQIKITSQINTPLTQTNIDNSTSAVITQVSPSRSANIITVDKDVIISLSGKPGFFTGSAFYIRNGQGAGQLRKITNYEIINEERIVTLDSPFTITPDGTSQFEIAPAVTITGDGTGALAISHVNTITNGIKDIEIINRGSGYTFANVTLVGTSGMIDTVNQQIISPLPAVLRAIISPRGGHGSNLYSELFAHSVCISKSFVQTEVPYTNEYNKIGLLNAPQFSNTVSTSIFDGRATANTTVVFGTAFEVGELVVQTGTGYTALVHSVVGNNLFLAGMKGDMGDTLSQITGQTSGTVANINSIQLSNRITNTGTILYIEDLAQSINRSNTQTETIKLVIEY